MKILVVGYGSIGKRHVTNLLQNTKAEIIICTKRKDIKFSNRNVKVVNSLNEGLKEKPTIGLITNETVYHIPTAIKLAKEGLDLFIEKPLSNSIKGIKTLQRITKEKKLIVQMGFHMRFHKCIIKIHELLEKKKVGRVISGQVENSSYLPDWHPYEDYRKGYAAKEELGGGITTTMTHELDFLRWFFGDIKEIFSLNKKISDLEISADDISTMTMIFEKNIIGELHLDYFARPQFKSCKIKGSKGTIYWNSDLNEVKIYLNNKNKWKTIFRAKNFKRNDMFLDELNYFLKSVKLRKKTFNDISEGMKTLKVILSSKKSSSNKKMLKIKY